QVSPIEMARSAGLAGWLLGFKPLRRAFGMYDAPGRRHVEELRVHATDWIGADSSRPFLAFMNIFDAHDPYIPGAPFDSLFGWPGGDAAAERLRMRRRAIQDPLELPAADL